MLEALHTQSGAEMLVVGVLGLVGVGALLVFLLPLRETAWGRGYWVLPLLFCSVWGCLIVNRWQKWADIRISFYDLRARDDGYAVPRVKAEYYQGLRK